MLVTAGGTREPIDAVRFIGNRSSGRMGFALAEAAAALGASVTAIAANVALERHPLVRYVDVETAAELQDACTAQFAGADVLLMAAAVADFRPARPLEGKLKKGGDGAGLALDLVRTPDILARLAANRRPGQTLVGFAAEHGDGALAGAREKLVRKQLDAIVVNDVSRAQIGFDAVENEVTIVSAAGAKPVARAPKAVIARAVLEEVMRLRAGAGLTASDPAA